ncbi:NAD-binding phosphogluconate dehydrogenase-like protein [Mycena indigotica]|uniref:NAD-binding phosphogluconate dehydrogenase-like protein n=1 Tax=Mycena indigotica TaxID=2126181 RepID=A0A8H6TEL6_9AGAR|nr:NAD-binding phosphogluconate dehydrogenase-like protein [Mycena indigotica]KAF7315282.1 NAD-binding phosphogluconate dehydrogenase-like protein [Mycena indigotica]
MVLTIAVISAGAMGAAIARRLVGNGVRVLTNLTDRSEATRKRAQEAGMQDVLFQEIASCDFMLSVLPPSDAYALAEKYLKECSAHITSAPIFVDCNAVNPSTVREIAALFSSTQIQFIDACIIGGPPTDDGYNPTFYASGQDSSLARFESLSQVGLKISLLRGNESGVGDASALKMSYAGITKGITGLFATMILSAFESSPNTAEALLHELKSSQPALLQRIVKAIPMMIPKAYRWVGEMEEIAGFVGEGEGEIYMGLSKLYARIAEGDERDRERLTNFVQHAQIVL